MHESSGYRLDGGASLRQWFLRKSSSHPSTESPEKASDGMSDTTPGELTMLLTAAQAGDLSARDRLIRAVYGELHRIASGLMRRERADHTLQPSALVNEALVRLLEGDDLARVPE